jgi:hypothetical protein
MPSGWFIRNVSTDRATGQMWLETSSVTSPELPVTFPKSPVTMPKPPVTLLRNTHSDSVDHAHSGAIAVDERLGCDCRAVAFQGLGLASLSSGIACSDQRSARFSFGHVLFSHIRHGNQFG